MDDPVNSESCVLYVNAQVHFKIYMACAFPGNRSHDGLSAISYRFGVGPQVGRGGQ